MAVPPQKKRRLSHSPSVDSDGDPSDVSEGNSVGSWDGLSENSSDSEDKPSMNGHANERSPIKENGGALKRTSNLSSGDGNSSQKPFSKTSTDSKPMNKNLFELQVDGLLRQVQQKSASNTVADEALRRLKTFLESLPGREPLPIDRAEKSLLKSKIVIPFPNPRPSLDAKYLFGFQKPSYINVVGSYAMKTVDRLEDSVSIDLVAQMPSELFTEKDYLNYRYFHKRAFYLACLAEHIQSSKDLDLRTSFSFLSGNNLLPVLLLQPKTAANENTGPFPKWKIQILPTIAQDLFPKQKTLPSKNCIRPSQHSEQSQATLPSTPFYNCSLRVDCSTTAFLKLLHDSATVSEGFRHACHLGRIWLSQRGFSSKVGDGGFGHFEWSALVAILMHHGGPQGRPVVSSNYDSQQLFRATIQFLAMRNLINQPIGFRTDVNVSQQRTSGPLVLDGASGGNLLYKMTSWSYELLRQEAQNTVRILSGNSIPKFESTFILKVCEPLTRYDLVATISNVALPNSLPLFLETVQDFHRTLSRGLGGRASLLNITFISQGQWPSDMASLDSLPSTQLKVGVVIDPVAASKIVDRGPAAEDSIAVVNFREFWGEKAELRRFKDGQILESIVWSGDGPVEITKDVITYLTHRQFANLTPTIEFYNNDSRTISTVTTDYELNLGSSEAYLNLENQIRSMEGLPLQVRQIQRSSLTTDSKHPQDVVLLFEESGRWPDDLEAIQMTKVAFLLKLQELLANMPDIESTKVGLENENSKILNRSFLNVIYAAGAIFRIRIHHDREQHLIEQALSNKVSLSIKKEEAVAALSAYKRTFIRKPLHVQLMSKISTRFTALAGTLRLVHAWFAAHLLTNHFRPEFVDLVTAATFLHPLPWSIPSSAQTGFLRTLLFISKWDWQNDPLIVDSNSNMKSADLEAIRTRFDAWRKVDPLMNRVALFAATDFDPEGETWTENTPSKLIAARLVNLAQAASRVTKEKGVALDLKLLFKRSLKDYDFVLRLSDIATGRRKSSKQNGRFKNLEVQSLDVAQDARVDLVEHYLSELQTLYGDSIIFFHGKDTDVIAGLWSPHTARRAWKVNLAYSTIPQKDLNGEDSEGADAAINKDAILAEIVRLGDDLVSNVEVLR